MKQTRMAYAQIIRIERIEEMQDKMRARTQETADLWIRTIQSDPLHLPRAPVLRHNVSLCHGRSTPLFSPSTTPAASAVGSIARVWNPRFWKLGGPNSTSWMQVALVLGEENASERVRETVFQHEFPPTGLQCVSHRTHSSRHVSALCFLNQRANPWCNLGWVVKILSLLWCFVTLYPTRGSPSGRNNMCVAEIMFYRWLRKIDKLQNARFAIGKLFGFLTIIKFQR